MNNLSLVIVRLAGRWERMLPGRRKRTPGLRFPGEPFAIHAWPGWTVTHLLTGQRVTCVPTKKEAIKVLRELRRLKLTDPLSPDALDQLVLLRSRYMQRWGG